MPKKTLPQPNKNILFTIAGGIGKNLMATAVVDALKTAHPKTAITIATAYPFVWKNNPQIVNTFDLNSNVYGMFRNTLVHDSWTIFNHDPYHAAEYLNRKNHLIDTWAHLCGVEPTTHKPSLYLTDVEIELAKRNLPETKKPLFFIQTNGGAPNQRFPISWSRDLPLSVAQEVVNEMNKKGYHTVHLRRDNQPSLNDVSWVNASARDIAAMLPSSSKRLFIDSFPQHAAAALGLPSVVAWISNQPETFGYAMHANLRAKTATKFRHRPDSYLELFDITGVIEQCPYTDEDYFSAKEILKLLQKQK